MENGKCVLCGDLASANSDKLLCEACAECLDPSILIRKADEKRRKTITQKS